MKTVFDHVTKAIPVIRVNNRDLNLAFYTETLGLKVISEENALALLGGKSAKTRADASLILEESPSMRTRAVDGLKKLGKIVIESPEFSTGFEAVSPEGDRFEIVPSPSVTGDIKIKEIQLNTPRLAASLAFYTIGFGLPVTEQTIHLPFADLTYVEAEGTDLLADSETVWDIEILEFAVAPDVDLHHIAGQLDDLNLAYYVDKKGKVLTMTDEQNIEIWFMK